MTNTSLTGVGIAEIVIYAPALITSLTLAFFRHARPRMAWLCLSIFCCFRFASGILAILYQRDPSNSGIFIGAVITLAVGVIPLLLCTIGFIRIIHAIDFPQSEKLRKSISLTRATFFLGIALLVAGGVLSGMFGDPGLMVVAKNLEVAGYAIIAGILALMLAFETFFAVRWARLGQTSRVSLVAISAAMPFQVVRIAYAFLNTLSPSNPEWSILSGSTGPFVGMVLIMELAVVVIYTGVGFWISPVGRNEKLARGTKAEAV